ncbi:hypothetical protein VHEMI07612 [[Torrubiella] hemipterigena]|uniref:Major facilitator superfamily (MFS) profile domain-containing protein n=1 Tax=[Torrubiella] hemipterigena TaxID=1531966 RepID=A0A0A1TLM8_9HYPO|nr:hypothetical protein VHEMI07612 [[Torrubiella] hemipterigena]
MRQVQTRMAALNRQDLEQLDLQHDTQENQDDCNNALHSKWRRPLIIIAAFMLNFSGCGLLFSWGIYQAHYEEMSKSSNNPFSKATSADITLIGSIAASLTKLCAPLAVAWSKEFTPRAVILTGGILYGVASVLASFSKDLWQFQLTQGLLIGIATCLSFMPSMAVPPAWFNKNRALSMGVISSGTGIGGLVWSPILSICIRDLGYRDTLRLTGCVCSVLICISALALDWEPEMAGKFHAERSKGTLLSRLLYIQFPSKRVAFSRKFAAQSLNAALQSAAYYTPVFYIASYSKSLGYSDFQGSNFTSLSNACNAMGKIVVGFIADRIGRLDSFCITTLLSSVSTAGLWVPSSAIGNYNILLSRGLFIGFTVIYGLFASAYIGLFSPALFEIFGAKDQPRVVGFMYMLQGAAGLIGTPVAGALIRGQDAASPPGNYLHMAIFTGALMIASVMCVLWAWMEVLQERRNKSVE